MYSVTLRVKRVTCTRFDVGDMLLSRLLSRNGERRPFSTVRDCGEDRRLAFLSPPLELPLLDDESVLESDEDDAEELQ